MAKYFLELMLVDYESIKFLPSLRAASALSLSLQLLDKREWVSKKMSALSNLIRIKYVLISCMYGDWLKGEL